MIVDDSIFREYDIRGIVGENLNEQFACVLGRAFAKHLKKVLNKENLVVSIGYDARLSSKDLFRALCFGLNYENVKVIDIGLVATPVAYFSLFNLPIDGGVMITASHNPPQYNGFKLSVGKNTIFGDEIQTIKDIVKSIDNFEIGKAEFSTHDIIKEYTAYMLNQFKQLKELPNKPKVVLDAGNGTGGFIAYPILKELGFDVIGLFIEPDGTFPNHHPDPTVEENLKELKRTLKEKSYDIGIGYDGDADRIGVVLKNGDTIYGDQLLLLFAQHILKEHKGATIIGEVKCSKVLYDKIEQAGGKAIMWKAGHSLIKAKMKEEKALLGGEMSGHIFFADRYFGYDDAIYVSLRLLEILSTQGLDLEQWKKSLPVTYNTPEIRIDCPEDKKVPATKKVEDYFIKNEKEYGILSIVTIDGIRFNTKDGWGLVRSSNTQPALVLRFEANSPENLKKLKNDTLNIVKSTIEST
ncbi:phosphomannomutase/phosphoglucomutase [Desulfurella sp.]|uniref:phosphomannomutase/phosphoglucomutase n=1 Tax=Desulfurella sp. TaxID=1962857 RepID=UPI003D0BAEB9